MYDSAIKENFINTQPFQHYPADSFPMVYPIHWLTSHFAVGGWSPLQRLSGMLTAHMTTIAPRNGFTWHPHRGVEIYTWVLDGTLSHEDTTGGKGDITAGELQRMFSGDWIEHQELNHQDEPARVIQIWYAADPKHMGLEPHYQQANKDDLPTKKLGDATLFGLIGEDSPMQQHMTGRLTATSIPAGGETNIEPPRGDEDLFLYVTDGSGRAKHNGHAPVLAQYDVILANAEVGETSMLAADDSGLDYLSFYLPKFIEQ
ncbi:MAG: pirin family protein [Chloroflexota bacterium]